MIYPVQGKVTGITQKPTSTGGTIFKISLSDGNTYSTFDENLATRAHGLTGQVVVLQAERTDKGFLNAKDITGSQGLLPAQEQATAGIPTEPSVVPVSDSKPQIPLDDTQHRIMRGNALNAACALLGGVPLAQTADGAQTALEVARVFYNHLKEGNSGA